MISFRQKGDFSKLTRYFEKVKESAKIGVLDKYGREGVAALSSATPVKTGKTANSWYYEIERQNGSVSLVFKNSNVNFGVPNLDVYAGLAIGPGFHWYKDYAAVYFNWGTFIGAGWYFTDNFGLVAEAGYPYWFNVKASFKF